MIYLVLSKVDNKFCKKKTFSSNLFTAAMKLFELYCAHKEMSHLINCCDQQKLWLLHSRIVYISIRKAFCLHTDIYFRFYIDYLSTVVLKNHPYISLQCQLIFHCQPRESSFWPHLSSPIIWCNAVRYADTDTYKAIGFALQMLQLVNRTVSTKLEKCPY